MSIHSYYPRSNSKVATTPTQRNTLCSYRHTIYNALALAKYKYIPAHTYLCL